MHFDLKKPCANCPFRTDIVFPLERERVEEIIHSISRQDQTFACHKTTRHDPDTGEHVHSKTEQHCAGALIFLERADNPNQMMRISERLGLYDRTKLQMDAPVFIDGDDMLRNGHWIGSKPRKRLAPPKPEPVQRSRFGIARAISK